MCPVGDHAPGEGEHVDNASPTTLSSELRKTQKATRRLLALVEQAPQLVESENIQEQLAAFADAKIPTAQELFRGTLAGIIPGEGVMILYRRAKQSFHAALPAVIDMFFEKMQKGADCKYSERLLVEAMKGMGALVPSEPVSKEEREQDITNEEIAAMSTEDLMQKLREGAGFADSEND